MGGVRVPKVPWDLIGIPEPTEYDDKRSLIWNYETQQYEYSKSVDGKPVIFVDGGHASEVYQLEDQLDGGTIDGN